jgi:protein-L-isoaspartate(D-aspartate) O-methyltransferase
MLYDYELARESMVKNQLIPRGIRDTRVLTAMAKVPRHRFVDEALVGDAYGDRPLPIGNGQTISQPYIVALMTQAMELTGSERTLEVGTGSGYQAAILAELCKEVYTIERIESLLLRAREILGELGYTNVFFKLFDGSIGWKEYAPFDAIIVTAAAPTIPQPLLDQLAEGGRLVIPVGKRLSQELIKVTKKEGTYIRESLGGVLFVGLVGAYGWKD